MLNTKGVEELLRRVGLGRGNARSVAAMSNTALEVRLFRRCRWLALKLAGATGAAMHLGCCGMAFGVLVGCLAALPKLRLRFVRHTDDLADVDSWQALLLYVVSVVFVELILLSIRDPRWVKRGLRWGAVMGAMVGWLRALAVVDPDRHSFQRVFQMGLSGEEDIGVISPYAAQVSRIKQVLEAEKIKPQDSDLDRKSLEVKTVDGYQGREKEVIILSCVRTQGLGFLTDHRRLNVGITRAKSFLVVIGCSEVLRRDPVWASYLCFLEPFRWT
eukprot:symbB.v1.2.005664.t1/scaffold327.1/size259883/17